MTSAVLMQSEPLPGWLLTLISWLFLAATLYCAYRYGYAKGRLKEVEFWLPHCKELVRELDKAGAFIETMAKVQQQMQSAMTDEGERKEERPPH